jgi:glycosyltransferase involved in cell wall biosynthesis
VIRGPIYALWSICPEKIRNKIRKSLISRIFSRWLMDFDQYLSLEDKDFINRNAVLIEKPEVDVVITSYRQSAFLEQSMKSILEQTVIIGCITLVNHCPDNEEIERFNQAANLFTCDPRVKVLHLEECWPGEARNRGAALGNSPFILFVDADDWISSPYLENALLMIATTESDFAGADCEVFSETGSQGSWNLNRTPNLKNLVRTNAFPVGSVISRKMFIELKGWNDFDPNGNRHDEAIHFWRRALLSNYQGSNVRQQLIHLRRHISNLSNSESSLVSHKALRKSFKDLRKSSEFPNTINKKRAFSVPSYTENVEKVSTYKLHKDKDKVVFLIADGTLFGAGKVTQVLIEEFLDANKNVIILNFDYRSQGIPLAEQLKVHWVEFGSIIPRSSWLQTLQRWINEIDPSWVISTGHPDVDLLISALRKRNAKTNFATTMFNTKSLHSSFIIEESRTYDKILVESDFSKNWLVDNEIDESKIQLIRHLAHRSLVKEIDIDPSPVSQKGVLMGWFHRFSWEKQPIEYLRIAEAVEIGSYKFIMGGSGPLRKKIEQDNSNSKVQFERENISNVEFLKKINVAFVTSSEVEGRPLAVLEALEFGKVVIGFNVGALGEIASLGYEGLYLFDTSSQIIEFLKQNEEKFSGFKSSENFRGLKNTKITNDYVASGERLIEILK